MLVLTLCTVSPSANAAETQFTPIISVSETYTDNVLLAPRGFEEHDWVTQMSAGFNFSGVGRRARANVNYTPSLFIFARQDETDLRHQLSSSGQMELVRERFFLNGSAAINNTFAGVDRDISISDRNLSDDRIQVITYGISPELRNRFGSFANASLMYSYRVADYEEREITDPDMVPISDSETNSVNLTVDSGENFQRFRWTTRARWSKQTRSGFGDSVTDKYVRFESSYNLNRTVALTGSLGYRDFGFTSSTTSLSGMTWDLGVRLTPSRRTTLAASVGRDQNNNRWSLMGSYQPDARTSLIVSYNESYRTSQELDLDELPSVDDQPTIPGIGGGFDFFDRTDLPGNRLTNQVFLEKRFTASVMRVISRTTISLSFVDSDRSFGETGFENVTSGRGQVSHTFSRALWGSLRGSYIRRADGAGRIDDIYTASAYLSRTLSGPASVFVSFDHTRRDSNFFLFNMRENAVTAGLTARF